MAADRAPRGPAGVTVRERRGSWWAGRDREIVVSHLSPEVTILLRAQDAPNPASPELRAFCQGLAWGLRPYRQVPPLTRPAGPAPASPTSQIQSAGSSAVGVGTARTVARNGSATG